MTDPYTIRPFATIEDFRECVDLQEETWGRGFSERVAPAILKVSQILGGVSAGAYDADARLVGFVFGMTGLRDGAVVHWSDMLAVRPEAWNTGLGARLKAYQRDRLLALGVEKMFWTFDPLRSKNAHVNFNKLGIVVREYERDMYGQTDSPLHRGIGTDRFVALWLMSTERVRARLEGQERAPGAEAREGAAVALASQLHGDLPQPGEADLALGNERILVSIPFDIGAIMDADMELALDWRIATRAVFGHYLANGYEVRELLRGARTSEYLLVRDPRDG